MKIQTQRDAFAYRIASSSWYHVSPHLIKPGEILVPGGAESPWSEAYPESKKYVWVDKKDRITRWRDDLRRMRVNVDDGPAYLYEVVPESAPLPFEETGDEGWTTSKAKVKRLVEEYY